MTNFEVARLIAEVGLPLALKLINQPKQELDEATLDALKERSLYLASKTAADYKQG